MGKAWSTPWDSWLDASRVQGKRSSWMTWLDMTRAAMNYRERLSVRPEGTELTPDDVSLLTERFQQAYKARGALDEAVAVALDFCRKVY